jgi:GNAT superfamily N-acetyltransferase
VFRRATADDRQTLDEMTLAGVRYWGHHESHPEAYADLVASVHAESGPENHPVYVLEEDGDVAGFFELRDRGEHIELLRMFLPVSRIGHGYGRRLWDEAVGVASQTHDRMLIMSDPRAQGFYEAMGANLDEEVMVAPGFSLGKYWYVLSGSGLS